MTEKVLSHSVKLGKLCILFKKDDKTLFKNYRPLALMNSDYKIVTKALTAHLQTIVKEIVDLQQTGFIAGHNIKHNIFEALLVV
jgi:hypothetical protein